MYCIKCGKEIAEGSHFCLFCGAGQKMAEQPVVSAEPAVSANSSGTVKKNNKKTWTVFLGILIVIVGISLITAAVSTPDGDDDDDSYERSESRSFSRQNDDSGFAADSSGSNRMPEGEVNTANQYAQIAYDYYTEDFRKLYQEEGIYFQDFLKHGGDTYKKGDLKFPDDIPEGYVKIIKVNWDEYYDDSIVLQWCADKNGDGAIGQYPGTLTAEDQDFVEFGKIYR